MRRLHSGLLSLNILADQSALGVGRSRLGKKPMRIVWPAWVASLRYDAMSSATELTRDYGLTALGHYSGAASGSAVLQSVSAS